MVKFLKRMVSKNGEFSKTATMLWLIMANGLILMNLFAFGVITVFPGTAIGALAAVAGGTYVFANKKQAL